MLSIVAAILAQAATPQVTPADFWLPIGASTQAHNVDLMFNIINYICYFFFVVVVAMMVWFVLKYRGKPGTPIRTDGITHHTALELSWSVIPLLICIGIFFFGFRGYVDLITPPKNCFDVNATAFKWGWQFKYPNGAQSDNLVVPSGQPVRLVLRSNDVLHCCYIPAFRVKKDIVPGRVTSLWFQCDVPTGLAEQDGYYLFCAEYCGTGHSNMNRKVLVLPQAEFDEWLVKQAAWLDEIPDEELYFKAGPKIYARCSQCHSTDGTDGLGPTWKGIWTRLTTPGGARFSDGKSYADLIGVGKEYATPEDYIRDSIYNPGKHLVAPFGNVMPTFKGQLNDRGIEAITGMMQHLDEFDSKGAWTKTPPATPAAEHK
ncbi:MAG: cytochrome c oxidase subunit II [Phycisphaerales bacterium]|nr:cytochrome c oxidase subunit II [Phycisphaerales bacterium]